jgi:hypothetical protein
VPYRWRFNSVSCFGVLVLAIDIAVLFLLLGGKSGSDLVLFDIFEFLRRKKSLVEL